MGRLVNHGKKQEINSKMRTIAVNGEPYLCLFSIKSIESGQEILYDYGIHPPWELQSISTNKGLQQSHRNTHLEKPRCNEVLVQDYTAQQKQGGDSVPDSDDMGEMSQSSPSSLGKAALQNPQNMGEKVGDILPESDDMDEVLKSLPSAQKESVQQNPQISCMGEKEADIPPDSDNTDSKLQSLPSTQNKAMLQNPHFSHMGEKEADIPPGSDDMDEELQSLPSAQNKTMLHNPQISHMGEKEADIPPDSDNTYSELQSYPSAQNKAMLQNPYFSHMGEKEADIPPGSDDMDEELQSLPSAQNKTMLHNPQISHMGEKEADIPPDSDNTDSELQSYPSAQNKAMLQNPYFSHMGEKEADIPPGSDDMDEELQSLLTPKEAVLQNPQMSHMGEREADILPDSDNIDSELQSFPSAQNKAMLQNPQISHMGEKEADIPPDSDNMDSELQSLPSAQNKAMLQNPHFSCMGEREADIPPGSDDMDEELQSLPTPKEAVLQNPQISHLGEREADILPDSDNSDSELQSFPSAQNKAMLQNPQISHMGEKEADIPPDSDNMDSELQSLPSAQNKAMLQNPHFSRMGEKEADIPPGSDDMDEELQSLPTPKEAVLQNPQMSHMGGKEADIPTGSNDMDEVLKLQSLPSAPKEAVLQNPQISHVGETKADIPQGNGNMDKVLQSLLSVQNKAMLQNLHISRMGEKEADIPQGSDDMDEELQSLLSAPKEAVLQNPQISHVGEKETDVPKGSGDMDEELQSFPSAESKAMLQYPQISRMGEKEAEIAPDSDDMDEETQTPLLAHKQVMLQNLQISSRGEISFVLDACPGSSSSSWSDGPINLSNNTVYDPSDVSCSSDLDQNFSLNQNFKKSGYLNLSDVSLEKLLETSDSDETNNDNPSSDSDDNVSVYEPDKEGSYSSDSDCSAYEAPKVKVAKVDNNSKQDSSDREVQQPTLLTPADAPPAAAKVQETNDVTISEPTSSSKSVTYKKPYRMCPFCNTFKSKLSQHIATQHNKLKEVSVALKLPRKERNTAFNAFKKEGILKVNKSESKQSNPKYHREKTTGKGALVLCNICSGFFSRTYITRHANKCLANSEGCKVKASIPVTLLDCDEDYGGDFMRDILSRFRADEIGQLCTTDPVLVKIGRRLWYKQKRKVDKSIEVRKSVMTDMRRLAALYLHFDKSEESLGERPVKKGNISDLFQRTNFQHFEMAVDEYTSGDSGSDLKAGLKMALYYLLKTASKVLKATHLTDDEDDQAEDIDKFVAVLELNYNYLFGDASYKINKQRQVKLRKPDALPEEEDIKHLRDYTLENMKRIVEETELVLMDSHKFTTLRDLVVSRLTLFNARRGGEPSRLLLEEWNEAENGAWIDKSKVDNLDAIDSALIGSLKITYQAGKGNNHLVPVLFPDDTIGPIRKLSNKENRSLAAVAESNPFLFPSINNSDGHVSGWHSVNNVCAKLDLTDKSTVTATKNRHRVSTMFAMMDIPPTDRQYVYKHLGHTEDTNVNIYQTPLALKELTVVGRRLQAIDNGQTSGLHDKPSSSSTKGEPPSPDKAQELDTSLPSSSPSDLSSAKCTPTAGGLPSASTKCDSTANPTVRRYYQWSQADTEKVVNYFHDYFKDSRSGKKKLPGKKEILLCKERCGLPQEWKTIHTKVMNEVKKCDELARRRQESWN